MAPKPLRKQTHKSAASLPTSQSAKFLLNAAVTIGDDCPQVAAVLGRRSLQVRINFQHPYLSFQDISQFATDFYLIQFNARPLVGISPKQAACGQHGALSRTEASSLCRHCGAPLPKLAPDTVTAVKLSKSAILRGLRQAKKSQQAAKGQVPLYNKAALIIPCLLCGYKTIRPYYTLAAAQQAAKITS
jgi:hypothetical protein